MLYYSRRSVSIRASLIEAASLIAFALAAVLACVSVGIL